MKYITVVGCSTFFGTDVFKVGQIVYGVKEPDNSGQLLVRSGSLSQSVATVYNLGNGSWKEVNNSLWPTVTGSTTIYIQANKPGLQIEWLQFAK